MKRVGTAFVAVLVLGTGVGAHAATAKTKPKVRRVTISYTGGCGTVLNADGNGLTAASGVCPVGADYKLVKKSKEKYLSIVVKDRAGVAVSGTLWLSPGTGNATSQPFCGAMKNYPMAQSKYTMDIDAGVDSSCPGEPTAGTIVISYSTAPLK